MSDAVGAPRPDWRDLASKGPAAIRSSAAHDGFGAETVVSDASHRRAPAPIVTMWIPASPTPPRSWRWVRPLAAIALSLIAGQANPAEPAAGAPPDTVAPLEAPNEDGHTSRTLQRPATAAPSAAVAVRPFFNKPFRVVVERGGGALWPENTLQSLRGSANRWPDAVIGTEARVTADSVVVLLHDETVERTTNGSGSVRDLPLAILKGLDAGYRFAPEKKSDFPARGTGVQIPTLAEALEAVPAARFEIEIFDTATAVALAKVVRAKKAESRVLVVSRDPAPLAKIRELEPAIATSLDDQAVRDLISRLRAHTLGNDRPPGDVIRAVQPTELDALGLEPPDLAELRAMGIMTQALGVEESGPIEPLFADGIASITTNFPDFAKEAAASAAPPPPTSLSLPALRTLVVLGDSYGAPPGSAGSYADVLAKALEQHYGAIQVVKRATAGSRSQDLMAQIRALPSELAGPAVVVISTGGDELRRAFRAAIAKQDDPQRTALCANVGAAITALVATPPFEAHAAVHVLVADLDDASDGRGEYDSHGCGIPIGHEKINELFTRWNGCLDHMVATAGQSMVRVHDALHGHGFVSPESWYLPDCFHPTAVGHEQIAKAFYAAIVGDGNAKATTGPTRPPLVQQPGNGDHLDGYFEIKLRSGTSFKARGYTDHGYTIEVLRAGISVTISKDQILSIDPAD